MGFTLKKLSCLFVTSSVLSMTFVACQKKAFIDSPQAKSGVQTLATSATFPVIVTDLTSNGGPDITYKRGMSAGGNGGFTDLNTSNKPSIDVDTIVGMGIVNGIRNLYKEPQLGDGEFYLDGGVYKTRENAHYTDMMAYVLNHHLELLNQIGGTPTIYPLATQYLDTAGDYVPLPTVGASMSAFQQNFIDWASRADSIAGGPNYHSIWIAHQEPAHTLGYLNGLETDAAKLTNIGRFIRYWKPIAAALRAKGARVGGVQNNSANSVFYQATVDSLVNNQVDLDFLTFQFYQWGDRSDLDAAIASLKSYRTHPNTANTKMIVDRGMWLGGFASKMDCINTSKGLITYLQGERNYMDYADLIYAHIYDDQHTDTTLMEFKVCAWLNKNVLPKRRTLTGLPAGVDGFVTSNSTKLSAALWNSSTTAQNLTLQLNNTSFTQSKTLTVMKGTDSVYRAVPLSQTSWNSTNKTISVINLKAYEFVLITLQ